MKMVVEYNYWGCCTEHSRHSTEGKAIIFIIITIIINSVLEDF